MTPATKEPLVYCGPTRRGIAKQNTIYTDGIPAALEALLDAHPAARTLLVPLSRFAALRQQIETKGTAAHTIFLKVANDLAFDE